MGIFDIVDDFLDDPLAVSFDVATQPIRDIVIVVDGLLEGELREKATMRLGADVVSGMALSELIEWWQENK